jgi:hypothetical protein
MANDEEEGGSTEYYEAYRENFRLTFVLAGEHAKWLLSSLMLINSGAIAGIFQKGIEKDHWISVRLFGLGVLLALGAGILGWFNLQCSSRFYRDAADDLLKGGMDAAMPDCVLRLRKWGNYSPLCDGLTRV